MTCQVSSLVWKFGLMNFRHSNVLHGAASNRAASRNKSLVIDIHCNELLEHAVSRGEMVHVISRNKSLLPCKSSCMPFAGEEDAATAVPSNSPDWSSRLLGMAKKRRKRKGEQLAVGDQDVFEPAEGVGRVQRGGVSMTQQQQQQLWVGMTAVLLCL